MSYQDRREKALVIWEEVIRLMPTEVQLQGALWNCSNECDEVAEEVVEFIRAARAYPHVGKTDLFFSKETNG